MVAPAIIPQAAFLSTPIISLRSSKNSTSGGDDASDKKNGKEIASSRIAALYRCLLDACHAKLHGDGSGSSGADCTDLSPLQPIFVLKACSSRPDGSVTNHVRLASLASTWPSLREAAAAAVAGGGNRADLHLVVADSSAASTGYSWIVRNLVCALSLHLAPSHDETSIEAGDNDNGDDDEAGRAGAVATTGVVTVPIIGLRGHLASQLYRYNSALLRMC